MAIARVTSKWEDGDLVFYVGSTEVARFDYSATMFDVATLGIGGTEVTATAAQLNASAALEDNNTLLETDGTTKACLVNGVTLVTGGTGIADLTLAAPTANARSVIRIASLSSGSVVVTCASGVTVDGTNDVMTFDAADEKIELMYKSATEWAIVENDGAVALSQSA